MCFWLLLYRYHELPEAPLRVVTTAAALVSLVFILLRCGSKPVHVAVADKLSVDYGRFGDASSGNKVWRCMSLCS